MTASVSIFPALLVALWPLWVALALVQVVPLGPVLLRLLRHRRAGMAQVDRMSGREFEHYLKLLFGRLGYRVELTQLVGDYGADLILGRDGMRTLVQAKRWNRSVGIRAVQEAAAGRPYRSCDRAMVVTNSRFSKAARELARANRVELWDRDRLARAITSARLGVEAGRGSGPRAERSEVPQSPALPLIAKPGPAAPAAAVMACPRCAAPMVLRHGPHGRFYSCSRFPACRSTCQLSATPTPSGSTTTF